MNAKQFDKWLLDPKHKACEDGYAWAKGKTLKEAWDGNCGDRPDWMMWVYRYRKPVKKLCVMVAVYSARLTLDEFEKRYPDDKRPRLAIEAAEAVIKNDTPTARSAAASAASAWSAAESAWSAAWSAASARSAAESAESAWSAARSAAESAERNKQICTHIKKLIPKV